MRKAIGIVLILAVLAVVAYFGVSQASTPVAAPAATPGSGAPASGAPASSAPASSSPASGIPASGIPASGIPADATEAVVEYVHDGDTIFLEDGRKVRMLGINTPEIGDDLECFGNEATALTRSLLPEGAHVWVQQDVEPLDQYGRSLLFVYTDDGVNVNLELLREGAAEVEMYKPNVLLRDEVYAAQDAARHSRAGLWGACR